MLFTAGLATLVLLLESVTTLPPLGAGELRVTVPVTTALLPPLTEVGLKVSDTTPTTTVVLSVSILFDSLGSG